MVGQCEEAVRDYAALQAIDPKHGDLETLYPLAKSCVERLGEIAAAESRRDWQVTIEKCGRTAECDSAFGDFPVIFCVSVRVFFCPIYA